MPGKNMKQKNIKEVCPDGSLSHKTCPIFLTLSLIANKWSIQLFHHLLSAEGRTLRFNQLKTKLLGISQRELSKHLKEFECAGLVQRTVYPEMPPRVEYTLTKLGQSLLEPTEALSEWARKYGPQVQKNREQYSKKKPS